ncbi:Translation initiation factor IF-2, partial [Frankliniella fusca]
LPALHPLHQFDATTSQLRSPSSILSFLTSSARRGHCVVRLFFQSCHLTINQISCGAGHSVPSSAAGSSSQSNLNVQGQPMPWGVPANAMFMNPWCIPNAASMMAPTGVQPSPSQSSMFSITQTSQPASETKPWNLLSDEGSSDEANSDVEQKKKKQKLDKKPQSRLQLKKRGPGRPSKLQQEEDKFVDSLQEEVKEDYTFWNDKPECCRSCTLYKGFFALKACGHGVYCPRCINKLRRECIELKRPAKCLHENCFELVHSWLQLFNVSGCSPHFDI